MNRKLGKAILAGALLLVLPRAAAAEVESIELDVSGYLCGL